MLNRPFVHKRVHALLHLCFFFRRLRLGRPHWPQQFVEIQPATLAISILADGLTDPIVTPSTTTEAHFFRHLQAGE
jgi:hypothetical protein